MWGAEVLGQDPLDVLLRQAHWNAFSFLPSRQVIINNSLYSLEELRVADNEFTLFKVIP